MAKSNFMQRCQRVEYLKTHLGYFYFEFQAFGHFLILNVSQPRNVQILPAVLHHEFSAGDVQFVGKSEELGEARVLSPVELDSR